MTMTRYLRTWTAKWVFCLLLYAVSATTECFAELNEDSVMALNPPPAPPQVQVVAGDRYFSSTEVELSVAVLCFGSLAMLLQCALMWKAGFDYQAVLKMMTVTLVITGTLFLITAGYDAEQIAPAMGLFGTITGYLLGRETIKKAVDAA